VIVLPCGEETITIC